MSTSDDEIIVDVMFCVVVPILYLAGRYLPDETFGLLYFVSDIRDVIGLAGLNSMFGRDIGFAMYPFLVPICVSRGLIIFGAWILPFLILKMLYAANKVSAARKLDMPQIIAVSDNVFDARKTQSMIDELITKTRR